jgi:hypothetical protein
MFFYLRSMNSLYDVLIWSYQEFTHKKSIILVEYFITNWHVRVLLVFYLKVMHFSRYIMVRPHIYFTSFPVESCDSLTLKRSHYETSNFRCSYQSTWCNISEDWTLLLPFCENSHFWNCLTSPIILFKTCLALYSTVVILYTNTTFLSQSVFMCLVRI